MAEGEITAVRCSACGCKHCPIVNETENTLVVRGVAHIRLKRQHECRNCGTKFYKIITNSKHKPQTPTDPVKNNPDLPDLQNPFLPR